MRFRSGRRRQCEKHMAAKTREGPVAAETREGPGGPSQWGAGERSEPGSCGAGERKRTGRKADVKDREKNLKVIINI
jgi:hypothetical protein